MKGEAESQKFLNRPGGRGHSLKLGSVNENIHQATIAIISEQFRVIFFQVIGTQQFKNSGARGFFGKRNKVPLFVYANIFFCQA
jgi:hypothetical protein